MGKVTRRGFVKYTATATAGAVAYTYFGWAESAVKLLEPVSVDNPLEFYPERDWEKVYRDMYSYDSDFNFCCVPNDTHNCRLKAYVKNGIIIRIEQTYAEDKATDLQGNTATPNWHPRGCLKGYTLVRRFYNPHRLKYPMVRKGWLEWANAGFPRNANGEVEEKYKKRGEDDLIRVTWDEAVEYAAKGLMNISSEYVGEAGANKLRNQGYEPEMIEAMKGAGTQTCKFRPGMGLLGVIRIIGNIRFTNMLQLLDGAQRGVGPGEALGGRYWSNYTWHGDLDPGTPMVTGVQTYDMDQNDLRFPKMVVQCGKNLVENKMPDAHWFIETIERGGKVVVITPEYSPTAQKAEYWMSIRPGSDVALFLAMANVIMREKIYDESFVKRFTDLPLLVRADNKKMLRASDLISGYQNKKLDNYVEVRDFESKSEKLNFERAAVKDGSVANFDAIIPTEMRERWGDFMLWDNNTNQPKVITRDDVGDHYDELGVNPALEGTFTVTTVDGKEVEVKPLFQLYMEITEEYDPQTVHDITGTNLEMITRLARDIAKNTPGYDPERPHLIGGTQIHCGEGVNHYFHNDQKDRVIHLVLALTGNVGKPGANKGQWAGNYKHSVFGVGLYPWVQEDPWNPSLDENMDGADVPILPKAIGEEVCYWNYDERPLVIDTPKYGRKVFTGKSHMPTPTKSLWYANVNLINNAKWHYQMVRKTNKKIDMIVVQNWEFAPDCDEADIVFPVNSWAEFTHPDLTASCSNPFLQIWPKPNTGIPPIFDTKMDHEILALVAKKLTDITGDQRYADYWKFTLENKTDVYIQRILDGCVTTRGYNCKEILDSDREWLMMFRTYPRIPGWEQINESRPFHTKTGRMEFYREEEEFLNHGENFIIYREQPEATPYMNNVIVSTHSWINPVDYGIPHDSEDLEAIQVRNVKKSWSEVKKTENFLWKEGYRFYALTPKTRHRVHSSWSNVDWNIIWDNNFADPHRADKRKPYVGEHQVHMNPSDAKGLSINDGDYVYIDANHRDRPYIGYAEEKDAIWKKASRLMIRVKYNPAYPSGIIMMKHSVYQSSPKTIRAHETRKDGLAMSESPGGIWFSNFRYGGHQSLTRAYLQPTQMTETLVRKDTWGWGIGEGFAIDTHAPNTCPKECLVKVEKAEDGGMPPPGETRGKGVWEPATTGFTPSNESANMKKYIKGEYIE